MLRSGDIWEGILHKSFKGYIKGIFIKYVIDIDTGKSNWIYQNAHWRATASELSGYKESAAFYIEKLIQCIEFRRLFKERKIVCYLSFGIYHKDLFSHPQKAKINQMKIAWKILVFQ